jgi:DNA processing protein
LTTIPLTADGQVIALACSALALEGDRSVKPLTPTEWHKLTLALRQSPLERPRDLLGLDAHALRSELGIAGDAAERLARLLGRGGQLAFAVERLAQRGIWVLTRADEAYPPRFKKLLAGQAPPLLFGAGPQGVLAEPSVAVVGSRDADEPALGFARDFGLLCARQRTGVVSGAARGVDLAAMLGAIDGGGTAIGVTVDPLERLVRRTDLRGPLTDETLTLVTPFHPSARWHAGNAMRRNRLVYVMSRAAVVAATAVNSGGTWAGAIENIEREWVPIYVRADGTAGSRELARAGAQLLHPGVLADLEVEALFYGGKQLLLDQSPADDPVEHAAKEEHSAGAPAHADEGAATTEARAADGAAPPANAGDAFGAVWPLLEACLQLPQTERDVADALNLQPKQARVWLDRAVSENLAKVRTRPKKLFVVRDGDWDQLSLG